MSSQYGRKGGGEACGRELGPPRVEPLQRAPRERRENSVVDVGAVRHAQLLSPWQCITVTMLDRAACQKSHTTGKSSGTHLAKGAARVARAPPAPQRTFTPQLGAWLCSLWA